MTATDFLLENGAALNGKSEVSFVVSCANGIDQPRWSLIEDAFYSRLPAPLSEAVAVGPVFHVNAEAPEQEPPFSVLIQLEHAVFAAGQSGNPATLYDSTHDNFGLVTVIGPDRVRARVTWNGMGVSHGNEGWARWIARLYVEDKAAPGFSAPIYLGFTCMWNKKRSELEDKLMPKHSSTLPANAVFMPIPQAEHKLSIQIDIEGEREPRFPDLFKPRQEAGLPGNVYLEPLIVIRKSEQLLELEFTSDDAILFPCDPSTCNPSIGGREPLALAWLGVTNPKMECRPPENEPVSRGFVGSWVEPQTKSAIIRWREPQHDDSGKRVASFFFVKQAVIGGESPTATFQFGQTLIDPTIVYDNDDPPRLR